MRDRWFVANKRERIHGGGLVCHRCARVILVVVVGLSQTCESDFMGYRRSIVVMGDGGHVFDQIAVYQ